MRNETISSVQSNARKIDYLQTTRRVPIEEYRATLTRETRRINDKPFPMKGHETRLFLDMQMRKEAIQILIWGDCLSIEAKSMLATTSENGEKSVVFAERCK
jgi:hypothetical protein